MPLSPKIFGGSSEILTGEQAAKTQVDRIHPQFAAYPVYKWLMTGYDPTYTPAAMRKGDQPMLPVPHWCSRHVAFMDADSWKKCW